MSGIIIIGDIHGHFERLNTLIHQKKPQLILQCGDFGYWPQLEDDSLEKIDLSSTSIYFCDGNVDDINALNKLSAGRKQPVAIRPGLYYMPRGSVLELPDGRRAMFMGGAMSRDKHQRHPGVDWFPEEVLCSGDLGEISEYPIDVIISHTCPEEFSLERYKVSCSSEIDPSQKILSAVLEKYQPALWFFGHWHFKASGHYGHTAWYCLGWQKEIQAWHMVMPQG